MPHSPETVFSVNLVVLAPNEFPGRTLIAKRKNSRGAESGLRELFRHEDYTSTITNSGPASFHLDVLPFVPQQGQGVLLDRKPQPFGRNGETKRTKAGRLTVDALNDKLDLSPLNQKNMITGECYLHSAHRALVPCKTTSGDQDDLHVTIVLVIEKGARLLPQETSYYRDLRFVRIKELQDTFRSTVDQLSLETDDTKPFASVPEICDEGLCLTSALWVLEDKAILEPVMDRMDVSGPASLAI